MFTHRVLLKVACHLVTLSACHLVTLSGAVREELASGSGIYRECLAGAVEIVNQARPLAELLGSQRNRPDLIGDGDLR